MQNNFQVSVAMFFVLSVSWRLVVIGLRTPIESAPAVLRNQKVLCCAESLIQRGIVERRCAQGTNAKSLNILGAQIT